MKEGGISTREREDTCSKSILRPESVRPDPALLLPVGAQESPFLSQVFGVGLLSLSTEGVWTNTELCFNTEIITVAS